VPRKRPRQKEVADCGDELQIGANATAAGFRRAHALTFRIELHNVFSRFKSLTYERFSIIVSIERPSGTKYRGTPGIEAAIGEHQSWTTPADQSEISLYPGASEQIPDTL
jgi:hypothetical protein